MAVRGNVFFKLGLEHALDVVVLATQQFVTTGEEPGLGADGGEERRHFAADEPAADDEQAFGHIAFERKQAVARPHRQMGEGRRSGPRTGGDDDPFRSELTAGVRRWFSCR